MRVVLEPRLTAAAKVKLPVPVGTSAVLPNAKSALATIDVILGDFAVALLFESTPPLMVKVPLPKPLTPAQTRAPLFRVMPAGKPVLFELELEKTPGPFLISPVPAAVEKSCVEVKVAPEAT